MLTKEEYHKCNNKKQVAEHLQWFCQHWSNRDDCPQHFEDMIRRFISLSTQEQKKFYVINDKLYTIEQVTENCQLLNPNGHRASKYTKGWYKTN